VVRILPHQGRGQLEEEGPGKEEPVIAFLLQICDTE
jgi:hypothetical protein